VLRLPICGKERLVAKKSNTSMFPRRFKVSLVLAGAALGLAACSSDSADNTDGGGTPTTGGTTTATMTSATSGTTMGSTATMTTASSSATVGSTTVGSTTAASTTAGSTTSGTTGSTTSGSTTDTSTTTGTATGGGGAGGTSGAGGTTTTGGTEDFDVTPEDFTCIRDWERVSGFRITNVLGETQTAEAIAVAQNPAGGVYPVGTIIQHLPTEAMVKRYEGFSPDTKDWEFFLLQLSADGATISQRGTTEITTMGNTCVSCHSAVADEFDFICNTWADATDDDCGFDFSEQQLNANDPRCD